MACHRDATGMSLGIHWDAAEAQRRVLSNIYSNANIAVTNGITKYELQWEPVSSNTMSSYYESISSSFSLAVLM